MKHGLYSKYIRTTLGAALSSSDKSLLSELEAGRAMLVRVLELAESYRGKPAEFLATDMARRMTDLVRRIALTIAKIEDMRSITPEQVEMVLANITRALSRHVQPDVMSRVLEDLRGMPWPTGVDVAVNEQQGRPELMGVET